MALSKLALIIGGVALLLLLLIVLPLVGLYGLDRAFDWMGNQAAEQRSKRAAEPLGVTREHLDALNQDDYARAYSLLSNGAKEELTLKEFTRLVREKPQVFKTSYTTLRPTEVSDGICTLSGRLINMEDRGTRAEVTLIVEDEQWRLQSFYWKEGEVWRFWGIAKGSFDLSEGEP